MPELKSVYFAPDGTFFDKREECVRYESCLEIAAYFDEAFPRDSNDFYAIASHLLKRYRIEERYDYKLQETTPDES